MIAFLFLYCLGCIFTSLVILDDWWRNPDSVIGWREIGAIIAWFPVIIFAIYRENRRRKKNA
jgi:hypothetical protein